MKKMWSAIGAMLLIGAMPVAVFAQSDQPAGPAASAEQRAYEAKVKAVLAKQRPQNGDITLTEAKAVLHLGQDYYYLDAAQAREVIVDMWGNPSAQADGVLGLVFPAGKTFVDDDAWGAVITYEQSGYVKDDDAASTDYDALMADMKSGEEERNKERADAGYPAIQLVGWAERPAYDKAHHSVIWARDMRFGNAQEDTLNYDVRLLGRYGVLSLNMVSTMSQLPSVKAAAAKFGASVSYDAGARYADYVPNVDKVAEYGIGGMIAAGAGLLAAKKLGLIALILAFGKKLLIPIILVFGGGWRWIKRRLGKGEEEEVAPLEPEPVAADAPEEESAPR
ncbi:DUF2167 domain-containing protein [Sphingobium sp.]|jgi:uncharacterized membrane-anchored protein|uniref:DUF2167 domain-containing protein n=1 Tax=Sphingobium sp. TaxID=1912891 RepID=UPI00257FC67C|nr:DUF2167 domain-containing protein [Sphingobium sp.]MBR2267877.1 DUF2167 domain-containing protein [Sphingobium sp.]